MNEGDTVENFELKANDDSVVSLDLLKNKKNVVLCFYPKNHLFGCPSKKVFKMAKSVIEVYSEILATDSALYAISIDSVQSQKKFVEEYNIPYLHLSDPQKSICKIYSGLNIAGLAKRSTFVIDKQGILKKIFRDIHVENHGHEILNFLKTLEKSN